MGVNVLTLNKYMIMQFVVVNYESNLPVFTVFTLHQIKSAYQCIHFLLPFHQS